MSSSAEALANAENSFALIVGIGQCGTSVFQSSNTPMLTRAPFTGCSSIRSARVQIENEPAAGRQRHASQNSEGDQPWLYGRLT
jgi:hypothetical protein